MVTLEPFQVVKDMLYRVKETKCTDQFVAGKEASAGTGAGTDERGLMQSSPQLQQQRAVLASLAVDPGVDHKYNDNKNSVNSRN